LVLGESSPIRRVLNPQPSPNLRVERIGGAGHEAPERVLDLTLEHLAGA
jgi:hypothetical protein